MAQTASIPLVDLKARYDWIGAEIEMAVQTALRGTHLFQRFFSKTGKRLPPSRAVR
jgi:hypothetical protein